MNGTVHRTFVAGNGDVVKDGEVIHHLPPEALEVVMSCIEFARREG